MSQPRDAGYSLMSSTLTALTATRTLSPTFRPISLTESMVITDSMCGTDHVKMKMGPDPKCVRECVHSGAAVKFALYDGKQTYKLSDQATPAQYAGQKVRVSGTLYERTGIIAVKSIEVVR